MCCATWKLWYLCQEGSVFFTPINDNFVFVHLPSPSLYF